MKLFSKLLLPAAMICSLSLIVFTLCIETSNPATANRKSDGQTISFVPTSDQPTWDQESAVIHNGLALSLVFSFEETPERYGPPRWNKPELKIWVDGQPFRHSVTPVHCRLDDSRAGIVRWILDWSIAPEHRFRRDQVVWVQASGSLAHDEFGNHVATLPKTPIVNRSLLNEAGRYTFDVPAAPNRVSGEADSKLPVAWDQIHPSSLVTFLDADRPSGSRSDQTPQSGSRIQRLRAIEGQDALAINLKDGSVERGPIWYAGDSRHGIQGHAVIAGGGGRTSDEGVLTIAFDSPIATGVTRMWVARQIGGAYQDLNTVHLFSRSEQTHSQHPDHFVKGVHAPGSVVLLAQIIAADGSIQWRLNGQPLTRTPAGNQPVGKGISLLAAYNGRDATADQLACFAQWNQPLTQPDVAAAEQWAIEHYGLKRYRDLYVSNDGDDANDGLSPESPKRTLGSVIALIPKSSRQSLAAVTACARVSLSRGSKFNGIIQFPNSDRFEGGGVDWSNPILFGAYGQGPRPRVRGLAHTDRSEYVVCQDLDIVDARRVPPEAMGGVNEQFQGKSAIDSVGVQLGDEGCRVLIAGCDISHHSDGIIVQGKSAARCSVLVLSRNRIHGTAKYRGVDAKEGRASGIFVNFSSLRCVMSENIWDMNGHIDPNRYPALDESPATIYSHHQYLSSGGARCRIDSIGEYLVAASNNATMMRTAGGRVWLNIYQDNPIDGYCGDGQPDREGFGMPASVWRTIHWAGKRPANDRVTRGTLTAINQGFHMKVGSDHRLSDCVFDKGDASESVVATSLYLVNEFGHHGRARASVRRTLILDAPGVGFLVRGGGSENPFRVTADGMALSSRSDKPLISLPRNPGIRLGATLFLTDRRATPIFRWGETDYRGPLAFLKARGDGQGSFKRFDEVRFRPTPMMFERFLGHSRRPGKDAFRDRVSKLEFDDSNSPIALADWARAGYQLRKSSDRFGVTRDE